jgi:hypothetical protein
LALFSLATLAAAAADAPQAAGSSSSVRDPDATLPA